MGKWKLKKIWRFLLPAPCCHYTKACCYLDQPPHKKKGGNKNKEQLKPKTSKNILLQTSGRFSNQRNPGIPVTFLDFHTSPTPKLVSLIWCPKQLLRISTRLRYFTYLRGMTLRWFWSLESLGKNLWRMHTGYELYWPWAWTWQIHSVKQFQIWIFLGVWVYNASTCSLCFVRSEGLRQICRNQHLEGQKTKLFKNIFRKDALESSLLTPSSRFPAKVQSATAHFMWQRNATDITKMSTNFHK